MTVDTQENFYIIRKDKMFGMVEDGCGCVTNRANKSGERTAPCDTPEEGVK